MMSLRSALVAAVCFFAIGCGAASAWAMPPFFAEFQAKYLKADASDDKDKEFALLVTQKVKCDVCHVRGKPKTMRNPYGTKLSDLLDKENFKPARLKAEPDKVKAEIAEALDKVAAMKSGDENSPTFGELIAQHKLPGGDVAGAASAQAPAPAPQPAAPTTPAPAEKAPDAAPAPAPEVQAAIAEIQKTGGTVMQLAQNDDSQVVDFHLGGAALGNDGLAQVKALPKVVELNLKDTQVTDDGLAHLAQLQTLLRLHLEKTKITDAGLAHLKGLVNLEYLNLYGTAVTNAGLEHLTGLKNLKKLYVWQTQVNDEGIAKLKEALPGVTVVK